MRIRIAAVAFVLMFASLASAAEVRVASSDETVQTALDASAPGDTVVVVPGFYKGGWKLKPGAKDQPMTLKAERAGRVFIGSLSFISGFEKVPGSTYSYSRPENAALPNLRELDTGKDLRWMASIIDVEEVVGSYCFDEETKRLYVHPSDSAGIDHHTLASIPAGDGIAISDYTVVDGFVVTGFGGAGVHASGSGVTGAVIENCKLYRNGSGISLGAARYCVIRNNECWENTPTYSQGAQIYMQDQTENTLVEGNYIHRGFSGHAGLFIYGDNKGNTYRRNVVWGAQGFFVKGRDNTGNSSEFNVSNEGGGTIGMHWNTAYRSIAGLAEPDPESDLYVGELKADPKFVDYAWADCRLQSDSPARGKARGGKDLGAFQYQGDVFFVKPDGNDSAEGTSVASAWKTLARSTRSLAGGQTLYILPGHYAEPLVLEGKTAAAGQTTRVRTHGKVAGSVTVQHVEVKGCTRLELAYVAARNAAGAGLQLSASQEITLLNCSSLQSVEAGLSVVDCSHVSVQRCALWKNKIGLQTLRTSDLELLSSLVGDNAGAQVQLESGTEKYFGEFNAFYGAPLGVTAGGKAATLAEWQTLSGTETHGLTPEARPVAPAEGDFRLPAGTALATSGLYDSPVGPQGTLATRLERKRIERVEVVSVTRTSANLLWYTPGRMAGTALKWGPTAEYGELHDRTSDNSSEFELIHTVSVVGLKPGTTYHFRPGCLDRTAEEKEITWDDQDYTFTTATVDPEPRELFVSTTGDDAHDGLTPQTAWKTLHKAARDAHAGDRVTIAPGRYVELLRPLQTGTSEDKRITFRAEKPLSVFLEGGLIKFVRPGRPHDVQLHSKAYVTIENITGMFCSEGIDYGGYRDGWGYAGIFRMSGGCMNEFKGCVADARYRWMSGFVFFYGGIMPGLPKPEYAARISDSATLACWRAVQGIVERAPLLLEHNVYYVSMTGMYSINGGEKWISRSCIYQDLVGQKRTGAYALYWKPQVYDSDYCCFAWMPNSGRLIVRHEDKELIGLAAWQSALSFDQHSIEHTPEYGITPLEKSVGFDLRPITIEDFVLPQQSPLRGKGHDGADIGVRWEKYLTTGK